MCQAPSNTEEFQIAQFITPDLNPQFLSAVEFACDTNGVHDRAA